MNIVEYKKTIKKPLGDMTLVFLIRDNNVILGFKKRGFGKGNILGIGGKVEVGETKENAAKREVKEEIGVAINTLDYKGLVIFYWPHIVDESWNHKVHIFTSNDWSGAPAETDEIRPMIFDISKIPYEKMWDDNKYWLPKVLRGETVREEYIIGSDLKVISHT